MTRLKNDKNIIIIVGIGSILFVILQFYLLDYWEQKELVEYAEAFQKGYDLGLETAITTIFDNTQDCSVTAIVVGNSSKQLIDFNCSVNEPRGNIP